MAEKTMKRDAGAQQTKSANVLGAAIGVVGFLAVWELIYRVWQPPDYLFPSFSSVLAAIWRDQSLIAKNMSITGYEVVLSFAVAALCGLAGALVLHLWPRLAKIILPFILFAQTTPTIALAPVLIVLFGLGLLSKVIIAVLIAFFPMLINSYVGLKSLDHDAIELARSMRVRRLQLLTRFEFPAALPQIFIGAKIAMTYAVVGAVVAEFMSSNSGLGNLLLVATGALDAPLALGALVVLSLEGLILYLFIGLIERLVVPWHISHRRQLTQ
jgi:NitT/TauT family transport system permease protein